MSKHAFSLISAALLCTYVSVQAATLGQVANDRVADSCFDCEFNNGHCQYGELETTCVCNSGYILDSEWTCTRDDGQAIPWQPADAASILDNSTTISNATNPIVGPSAVNISSPSVGSPSVAPSPVPTISAPASHSPVPSSVPSPSPTLTASATASPIPSHSPTPIASTTPSHSPSPLPSPTASPSPSSEVLGPLEPTRQCRRPPKGKPVWRMRSYYHRFCTSQIDNNYYPEVDQSCSEKENKFIWHPGYWNVIVLLSETLGLTDHCLSISDYDTFKATFPIFTGPSSDDEINSSIPQTCEGDLMKWNTVDHPTLPIEDEVVKLEALNYSHGEEKVCLAARPADLSEDQYYIAACDHDNPDIWFKLQIDCDLDAVYDESLTPHS